MEFLNTNKYFYDRSYYYDISACHYNILKNLNYDISDLDINDKLKRNILIGKKMRDDKNLSILLREITTSLIEEYKNINNLKNEDILLTQYDGFISLKKISETHLTLDISLQNVFDVLIISNDRKKYIAIDKYKNEILIKGISNNYIHLKKYYEKILNINYSRKDTIFKSLEKIKDEFLFYENDIEYFSIPTDNFRSILFLKDEINKIEINNNSLFMMDIDDIDKNKYFINYFLDFYKSIIREFV